MQNLRKGLKDAVYYARMIKEIYTGEVSERNIRVEAKTDNRALYSTLQCTKQLKEKDSKCSRTWIREQLDKETVEKVTWVNSNEMIASDLTNTNARKDLILSTIIEARLH